MQADVVNGGRGFISRAPQLGFVGGFDGIRGLGVLMVLVEHAMAPVRAGGFIESIATIVDVFFMLSAFLIMTLLMQEYRANGRLDLRRFYARRALRLLPGVYLCFLAWLVLGAIEAIFDLVPDTNLFTEVLKDVGAGFFYVYHWVFPVGGGLIDPDLGKRPMGQFWSLSVEEQFYLVVALAAVVAVVRNRARAMGVLCMVAWLVIGGQRLIGMTGPVITDDAPAGLVLAWMNRPDGLLLGVALAVLNAHLDEAAMARWRRPLMIAAAVGSVLWLAMTLLSANVLHLFSQKTGIPVPYLPYAPEVPRVVDPGAAGYRTVSTYMHEEVRDGPFWFWRIGHSLAQVGAAPVVLCLARYKDWWGQRMWSIGVLRRVGRMSYTLYVWHSLPYLLIIAAMPTDSAMTGYVIRGPIMIAAAFLVSWPVFRYVEQRALGWKMRFSSEHDAVDLRTR